jgi:hypothetical protein
MVAPAPIILKGNSARLVVSIPDRDLASRLGRRLKALTPWLKTRPVTQTDLLVTVSAAES